VPSPVDGEYLIAKCVGCKEQMPHCNNEVCHAEIDAVNKLGSYEATMLTPAEILSMTEIIKGLKIATTALYICTERKGG